MLQRHPIIQAHLQELTAHITAVLNPTSILLLGSAARDELSFYEHPDDSLELFSDYECLVVTPHRPTADQRQALQTRIDQLEQQINNPNPLFHIDLLLREQNRLGTFPPLIFTYEMKTNGRPLFGADIRPQLPTVSLTNLDQRNTNEILYKRLWAILLHIPFHYITGQPSPREQRVWGYVLARNILDIPTVLLPPAGVLLPNYAARAAVVQEQYSRLPFATALGPHFPALTAWAMQGRQHLDFTADDLTDRYAQTVAALSHAIQYLLPSRDPLAQTLPSHAHTLLNEYPISRGEWFNLAKMMVRIGRTDGPSAAWRWFRLPKKGLLTLGLLAMHHSLLAYKQGDEQVALEKLTAAHTLLGQLHPTLPLPVHLPFPERWLSLRAQWAAFWQAYIRLSDPKYIHRFAEITQWQHE